MASASYDQTLSSASISHPTQYDVFISFRVLDTRHIFTDYLYDALHHAGIRTFKDDDKIHGGEIISDALVQAIHDSEIYIVVLSEGFAFSTWCLDELVEIFTCSKSRDRRSIIPVFYNIEPLAVREQTGSFKEAFEKHGTRFDMGRLNMWRSVLTEVSSYSGYLVPKNMSENYIISKVVDEASLLLNSVSCYPLSSRYLNSAPAKWDVFVSCTYTRCAFLDHLFDALDRTGVRTYRDNPELHSIEAVSDTLFEVIQESEIYVVVVSDEYASSYRCLEELVKIIEDRKLRGRLILPIFYNIEPLTVQNQIASFNEAFQEHETPYSKHKLDEWRAALKKIGNLSGYQVCKKMSQIDIINKVVERILLARNPTISSVANDLVGLDSRVKGITTFLSNVTDHVIKFGIHGTGVGKTSLAKVLFDQLWPGSFKTRCFLEDVKTVSGSTDGLVHLQQQLLDDVLPLHRRIQIDNVDKGIEVIRARICSKILIVIDDMDDPRTLDFLVGPFALGSIIIITAETEDLLDSIKVEAKYKVNGLDDADSRQLCWNF